ncbi:MAG: type II toxin-antitoxin system HicB family antitoxin [Acidobacteria bacterium]|nr:type II toxin-antitoxin system HicB family antitoxin [Acidobacteriota bacterium]
MKTTHQNEGVKARSYIFKVVIEEDEFENGEKAYHAYAPALKGCHTWGHTYEEALTNIQEAVELYVEDLIEAGEPIPVDPEKGAMEWPSPNSTNEREYNWHSTRQDGPPPRAGSSGHRRR